MSLQRARWESWGGGGREGFKYLCRGRVYEGVEAR